MKLVPVSKAKGAVEFLYQLLSERTYDESISHKEMPTMDKHRKFVLSNPYQVWYLLQVNDDYVGACYISKQRELGIGILKSYRGKGYATQGLRLVMSKWPGRFLANINPNNHKSAELFQKLGFHLVQHTYGNHC